MPAHLLRRVIVVDALSGMLSKPVQKERVLGPNAPTAAT